MDDDDFDLEDVAEVAVGVAAGIVIGAVVIAAILDDD